MGDQERRPSKASVRAAREPRAHSGFLVLSRNAELAVERIDDVTFCTVQNMAEAIERIDSERPTGVIAEESAVDGDILDVIDFAQERVPDAAALVFCARQRRILRMNVDMVMGHVDMCRVRRFISDVVAQSNSKHSRLSGAVDACSARYGLTISERRVLAALVAGAARSKLSAALGVQEETTKTHVKHILAKTQRGTLLELVSAVLRSAL